MPKLGISSTEADNLIAFLDWMSKGRYNDWPPKPILATAAGVGGKRLTAGQLVYQSQGCSDCHSINGIGGTSGPDLSNAGSTYKDWFFGHLKTLKSMSRSAMPPVTAADSDIGQLTGYMLTLKEEVNK